MSGSTWTWVGNTSDPTLASNWQLTSGGGNGHGQPQAGDTAIIPGGTPAQPILLNQSLSSNFLELLGNGSVEFANNTAMATNSGVDDLSIISAIGTATTLTIAGAFANFGMIAANGPGGSNTTIDIQANIIPLGATTLTLPGYAINYGLMEVDTGNTMTIAIGPNAELFNVGEILVSGGSLSIQADPSAIAGGYAPAAGAVVISGDGTLETNVTYASTVSGVSPTYAFGDTTPGNTLKIDNIGSFGGQILGFGAGDTIDLGTSLAIGKIIYSSTTGLLNLENAGGTILASLLLTSGAFQSGTFTVSGGTAGSFNIGTVGGDTVLTTTVQNDIYNNTTGAWQTAANWSTGVPGATDTALIGTGFSAPFALSTNGTAVSVGALTLGNNGETLLINSNTTVEPYVINQFGGSLEVATGNTLTTSALRMYAGSTLIDQGADVRLTGRPNTVGVGANNGTITISNSNTIGLRVSSGTLTVNGGTIDASPTVSGGDIFIGVDGAGSPGAIIVQGSSGAAAVVTDTFTELSSDPTSFGMLTLNGNVTWSDKIDSHDTGTSTGSMIIGINNVSGNSGTLTPPPFTNAATLLVENGATLNEDLSAQIGATTNSAGTATIETGAIWNIGSKSLGVGFNGTGSLSILSGGTVSTSNGGGVSVGSSLATADGTITVSDAGSLLKTTGGMSVGKLGHGVLNILNGGTVENAGTAGMSVGASAGALGTISISGTDAGTGKHAELLFDAGSGGLSIGNAGQGTLSVGTNGTIQINGTSGIFVGQSVGAVGSVAVSGGAALINLGSTASGITIGQGGTGTLSVGSGGTISLNGTSGIGVGQSAGAVGLITVSGAGALISEGTTATGMTIGQGGTGTLQVLNGGQVTIAAKSLAIGAAFGSIAPAIGTGTVTVDGKGSSIITQGTTGTLIGNINVGSPGTGVLSITNGGSVGASGQVFIGGGGTTSSSGTVTVNAGTLTAAGGFGVGNNGNGTLTVTGGGVVTNTTSNNNSFNIGQSAGSSGTVIVNSGTLTDTTGGFFVGQTNATGIVQLNGGALITGGTKTLSDISATGTGTAAATINGGVWTVNGQLIVGDTGSGSLTINSKGLVNAGTNSVNIGNQTGGNGTVTVSGGTLEAGSVSVGNGISGTGKGTLTVSSNGQVQVTSLSEAAGSKIDVTGGTITTGSAGIGQSGTTAVLTIGTLGVVSQSGNAFNIGVGNGTAASASVTVNTGGSLSTTNLFIGGGPNASDGTLTVNGGQVSNTGGFNIGNQTGSGTLTVQNGGSVVTNSGTFFTAMTVAGAAGAGALLSINSGQVSLTGGSIILGGSNESGSLSVGSSGSLSSSGTAVAEINATGTGTAAATISGGTWTSGGHLNVGDAGSGSLDINSNGVVNLGTNSVSIGNQSTGNGTVSVEGGGTLIAGSVGVSDSITGTSNALLNVGSAGVVEATSLNQTGGSISVVGGSITSAGFINIGQTAASAITTIGGLGVIRETGSAAGINIGSGNGGNGTVTVNAAGTLSSAGFVEVGGGVSGGHGVLTVNGGVVTAGSGIFVGGPAPGTITINGNGSVSNTGTNGILIGASNGSGAISVNSGTLSDTGPTMSIGDQFNSTGTLTVGATGIVSVAGLLVGTGGLIDMAGGDLSAGGSSTNNGAIDGFGTLTASFNNGSTISASGGRLIVTGGISGTGAITIGGGATLEVDSGLGFSQSVSFANSATAEALQLNLLTSSVQGFGLSNWQNGDELFIANGVTVTGANWLGGSGTLEVDTTGSTYDFTNVSLAAGTTPIFTTGSNFVELVSCFVTGTRIATERGEVAVEDLREGDRVQVVLGRRAEPVVWVGRRRVDCARHPEPRRVWPVRVAAGAFGHGRPCRDLWLSPDHAVFVGDVLIPVKHLVNGSTIAQVAVDEVTYFHVELPEHSVLLAEGLAVESYLDTGNRSNFVNGGGPIALYPDFVSRAWDAQGCAPLVVTGAELDAAKRWVNGLAASAVPATSAA